MKITAYHGTTLSAARDIKADPTRFLIRKRKRAKWLGVGVYFFQDAFGHAVSYANECSARKGGGDGDAPIVARASIDLRDSVDLIDNRHWKALRAVVQICAPAPKLQIGPIAIMPSSPPQDTLEVYNNHEDDFYLTKYVDTLDGQGLSVRAIRCAFIEGEAIHPSSWFFDQSHVQICVREPSIITSLEWISI